jgi:pantoate--beta-alanine ligase
MAAGGADMVAGRVTATPPERAAPPERVTTVAALREVAAAWRASGETIALVPTMGALHAGHMALVEEARRRAERTVVSIFVNPAQFGPAEDLAAYPRDAAGDMARLAEFGVDLVFSPGVDEMYPRGFATEVRVAGLAEGLCAEFRPVHFTGVATVVAKLLAQCRPDFAIFGEKDYQQLVVVRRLARDLDLAVEIVGVGTVREADGLACSSRNAKLSAKERAIAGRLNRVLAETAGDIAGGGEVVAALARGRDALARAEFDGVDYLELRDAETLEPVTALARPARLLAAVHVGACRLIDNLPVVAG